MTNKAGFGLVIFLFTFLFNLFLGNGPWLPAHIGGRPSHSAILQEQTPAPTATPESLANPTETEQPGIRNTRLPTQGSAGLVAGASILVLIVLFAVLRYSRRR